MHQLLLFVGVQRIAQELLGRLARLNIFAFEKAALLTGRQGAPCLGYASFYLT